MAKHGLTRSMSRVCGCLDNASTESFWEYYKDETLKASIDQYIYFYNHKRYQEKLDSLTPVQYRHQAA